MSRKEQKFEITQEEFEALKRNSTKSIIRESYLLGENPEISLHNLIRKFDNSPRRSHIYGQFFRISASDCCYAILTV